MSETPSLPQSQINQLILTSLSGESEWRTSLWHKRFPVLIGLTIVSLGIAISNYLVRNPSHPAGFAQTSTKPQQVRVTNHSSDGFTVSWLTDTPTVGFVKLDDSEPNLFLDDRDQEWADIRSRTHQVTLHQLDPDTVYSFRVGSGGQLYDDGGQAYQAVTTKQTPRPTQADPVYGQVVDAAGEPAVGAIVYLTAKGGNTLSTLVSKQGTWLVSLNRSWTADLSDLLSYPNRGAHLSIVVEGKTARSVGEILTGLDEPVPLITLGENFSQLDLSQAPPDDLLPLTTPSPLPRRPSASPDINGDGVINTSDLGLLRQAINQGSQDLSFDLNQDGTVDDQDTQVLLDNWGPVK